MKKHDSFLKILTGSDLSNRRIPTMEQSSMGSIDSRVEALAAMMGLLQIVDRDKIHPSLTHHLIQKGIPALVLEMGESMTVNEKNIQSGYSDRALSFPGSVVMAYGNRP
jgi:hypothetical protein